MHLKKNVVRGIDFSPFLAPNLSQLPQLKFKNRVFFRYLGPTWANLGQLGRKRRPKMSQDVPREPKWVQQASQESQNEAKRRPKRATMTPQVSQDVHTTLQAPSHDLLKPGVNEINVLRSKRGGFQGSLPLIRLPQGPGFDTF